MATNRRSYPNSYFGWYNDDDKLAIVWRTFTNDDDTDNTASKDVFDTYSSATVSAGLRISYHGRYGTVKDIEDDLKKDIGLDVGLHKALVCYVKYRLAEDMGDMQRAMYYKSKYERTIKQYPHRKSGIRSLAVPRL